MKKAFLYTIASALLFILSTTYSFAQAEKHHRIKLFTDQKGLEKLSELGVGIDHGESKIGYYFISDFSDSDLNVIKKSGIKYQILIEDVGKFYETQNTNSLTRQNSNSNSLGSNAGCNNIGNYILPDNFSYGSMGGYFTYKEILNHLDSMAKKYPSLITVKTKMGTLVSDKNKEPFYYVKISDNPKVNEAEPKMLYTALHHAREPMSASQLIMYMWYLLENYNTSTDIKYLLDNVQLYFVPCVNPDGYKYNQQTNPNGGGLWRKNRRFNGTGGKNNDSIYGVDLNRNYGYQYGYDNVGSNPNRSGDTYRGQGAFSEPETKTMRDFCLANNFQISLNYHSYANILIRPWNYDSDAKNADDNLYDEISSYLTKENRFRFGNAMNVIGYNSNGNADDWLYGEQSTKKKILALTAEIGDPADGFWPAASQIIDQCLSMLPQNLKIAKLLLKQAQVKDAQSRFISTKNGYLKYSIQRLGFDSLGTYKVSVQPLGMGMQNVSGQKTYTGLKLTETKIDSIGFSLSPSINHGQSFSYLLAISNGNITTYDTINKIYGITTDLFSNDGSSMNGWVSNTGWGISDSIYFSGNSSIADSPKGNYLDSVVSIIATSSSIDIRNAIAVQLACRQRWALEKNYDYVELQISTDSSLTWTPLCGNYSSRGSKNQDNGSPLYDAFVTNWVLEQYNLDSYIGKKIWLRYYLKSDQLTNADGFYFDDFKVEAINSLNKVGINTPALSNNNFWIAQNTPNPVAAEATINYHLDNYENGVFELINAYGQKIYAEQITHQNGTIALDVSKYPEGIYFYQMTKKDGEQSATKKLVIVR